MPSMEPIASSAASSPAASLPLVLVTCATGSASGAVIRALSASGRFRVRAGARNVARAQQMLAGLPAVECVRLDDSAAAAAAAFAGVQAVYLLMPRPAVQGGPLFGVWLSAIIAAKVRQVVLHSAISAAPGTPLLLATEHFEHEQAIRARTADIPQWTFLRPAFFHQNVDKYALPSINAEGCYTGSAASGRFASVDLRDLADAAVACFAAPAQHAGQTYVLTEELATEPAIAALIAEASGKPIRYNDISVDEHKRRLAALQLPPAAANDLLVLDQEKREEWVAFEKPDLEQLLGRKGRTLKAYISELSQDGKFTFVG